MSNQNKFLYTDMFGDGSEQQHKRETAIYIHIYIYMTYILRTVAVTVSLPWAKHGRNWHEYKTEIGNLWSCGPRMARSLCRA